MVLALSLGFFEVSGFGGYRFVGLANYRRMLADPLFLQSLRVTLDLRRAARAARSMSRASAWRCWCSAAVASAAVLRSLFFVPQMVSLVVVALVWQVLLRRQDRPRQHALSPARRLGGAFLARRPALGALTLVLVSVWFLMGFYMLIFLGGLQDIPREYYEAARSTAPAPGEPSPHHAAAAEAHQLLRAARFDGHGGLPAARPST